MAFDDSAWGSGCCGGWRVLVVDDEPAQLETIRRGLFLYGHQAMLVATGEEALAVLRSEGAGCLDLLITDLTLPGASGFEVIQEARRLRPGLPILAITGLSVTADIEAIRRQGVPVLQKPFCPDKLDQAIRALVKPSRPDDDN